MSGALPGRQIIVDVLTHSYRIVGKLHVTHTGVIGSLNDETTSLIELHESSLARINDPRKLVERFKVIRVVKRRIFAVSLSRRDDVGSVAWARGGYGTQRSYPLRVISPVFELDGIFEWSERFDLHAVMVEGTRNFMPLYDVNMRTILFEGFHMETPALLFNRNQVEALALKQSATGELSGE
jgi:hypothetical protein